MSFEDFIEATNKASTADELFKLLVQQLDLLGFDRLLYSFMTDSPLLEKSAEHGVIRNYPEDWMTHYIANNYTEIDPVYRTALVTRRPFAWAEVMEKQKLKPTQKKLMLEAQDAGLKDGVSLAIHGPMGETVGFGFASSTGKIDVSKDTLSKVYLLAHQFHLCYSELVEQGFSIPGQTESPLSPREREILLWAAKGKSNNTIAALLPISAKTVDFHFANIYRKLGVNNRILAVLKAFHLGYISI